MKRILAVLLTMFMALTAFVGCASFDVYTLTVTGEADILTETPFILQKAGTAITLQRGVVTDVDVVVTLNGEELEEQAFHDEDGYYYTYTFIMPKKASVIHVETVGGMVASNKTSSVTFTVQLDYGMHVEGRVVPLLGDNYIFFNAEEYNVAPLLGGDLVTITYTGEMFVLEKYPGEVVITNGEIISVKKHSADIIEIVRRDGLWYTLEEYMWGGNSLGVTLPDYVVHADRSFSPLEEIEDGVTLYATYQPTDKLQGHTILDAFALYDYPPNDELLEL